MWKPLLVVAITGVLGVQLHSQAEPAFEVASVKPNRSGEINTNFEIQGDRFTVTNATLRELIRVTYQVRDLQIVEAPEWIASERFDVTAKATSPLKPGVVPIEARQLLADRFRLKVHNEAREVPIYALTPARTDGTLGPSIQPVPVDRCPEAIAAAPAEPADGLRPRFQSGHSDRRFDWAGPACATPVAHCRSRRRRSHGSDGQVRFRVEMGASPD